MRNLRRGGIFRARDEAALQSPKSHFEHLVQVNAVKALPTGLLPLRSSCAWMGLMCGRHGSITIWTCSASRAMPRTSEAMSRFKDVEILDCGSTPRDPPSTRCPDCASYCEAHPSPSWQLRVLTLPHLPRTRRAIAGPSKSTTPTQRNCDCLLLTTSMEHSTPTTVGAGWLGIPSSVLLMGPILSHTLARKASTSNTCRCCRSSWIACLTRATLKSWLSGMS